MSQSKAPQSEDSIETNVALLLSELSAGIDAENAARLKTVASCNLITDAERAIAHRDPEGFRFALLYPLAGIVDALLKRAFPNSQEARFLFAEHAFVRVHFRNLFQEYEGSSCCNDKAGLVLRKLLEFYLNGKRIEFDKTAEYTYAIPTAIFTTHDAIVEFLDALQRLKRGYGDAYVGQMLKIKAELKSDSAPASTPRPAAE